MKKKIDFFVIFSDFSNCRKEMKKKCIYNEKRKKKKNCADLTWATAQIVLQEE